MTTEERLDFLEYRQELLFENSHYSRLLFEHKVTREQNQAIGDVFDEYRQKIDAGEEVHSGISSNGFMKLYHNIMAIIIS